MASSRRAAWMMTGRGTLAVAAAVAGSLAGCATAPIDRPMATDAVRNAVAAYDRAIAAKDAPALRELLADSFVYFTSTGQVRGRDRFIGFLTSPAYRPELRERSEIEVRVDGGTAVVASRWRGRGTWEGHRFDDDQRCSLVWTRTARAWRLASEHCTAITPDPDRMRQTLLRLHGRARTAHLAGDAGLLAPILADTVLEIADGRVTRLSREAVLARLQAYFDAVEFREWADMAPPLVSVSADGSRGHVIVRKRVRLVPAGEPDAPEEDTVFAWLEVYQKVDGAWRIIVIASTDRPGPP